MGKAARLKTPLPSVQPSPRDIRAQRRMKKSSSSKSGGSSGAVSNFQIRWEDRSRTDRLVGWLLEHETERLILFADSASNARAAGRQRVQGHTLKSAIHARIAEAVFSVDANPLYSDNYALMQSKFARAIDNRLTS